MPRFAPRLHVLLASHAPVGLVIRRGPSKSVATLLWDRRHDTFQLGQWLRGRIYERRSDLSHDGKFFLYFAMNGKWNTESKGSWTAISVAPYLKAIAFFPKGDCWNGGGLWTGKNSYWLNSGYGHSTLRNTNLVRNDENYSPVCSFGGECPGVYYHRLIRDGWTQCEQVQSSRRSSLQIFDRPLGHGWSLRKLAHSQVNAPEGKGCYWDEHELHGPNGTMTSFPDWEWAERDENRLVWAEKGILFAAEVRKRGLGEALELHDFNPMKFQAIEAPY